MSSDDRVQFKKVLDDERNAVNTRRQAIAEKQSKLMDAYTVGRRKPGETTEKAKPKVVHPVDFVATEHKDEREQSSFSVVTEQPLAGLALSGGGIRSAAYCLGVLQGLDAVVPNHQPQILDSLDYLSTVSGGGYIGISFAAAISESRGVFPFESKLDQAETIETQHLRDYSNYLLPGGGGDIVPGMVMLVRGLLVNALILLSAVLLAASVTVLFYPNEGALQRSFTRIPFDTPFGAVIVLAGVYGLGQVAYAIAAFWPRKEKITSLAEREKFGFIFSCLALVVVGVGALEFQAYVLRGVIDASQMRQHLAPQYSTSLGIFLYGHLFKYDSLWTALTIAVAAFGTFGSKLLKVVQATIGDKSWTGFLMHWGSRIAIYAGALLVPLTIWVVYLYLCFLAIDWNTPAEFRCLDGTFPVMCNFAAPTPALFFELSQHGFARGLFYLSGFLLLGAVSLLISPNANSLHGYYRDRLSRAFLWSRDALVEDVKNRSKGRTPFFKNYMRSQVEKTSRDDEQGTEADERRISDLRNVDRSVADREPGLGAGEQPSVVDANSSTCASDSTRENSGHGVVQPGTLEGVPVKTHDAKNSHAPYLLINTSVNLEGSKYLNRRGRNADSFFFSPFYVGSEATGYVDTRSLELLDSNIDLATAMAISGAAASANMGANTIRPMTFSLAVLNVRLGYWLPNPARVAQLKTRWQRRLARIGPLYFAKEVFGLLDEWTNNVYLTDGGHFDNLGIYQLIKRKCKVIIAVDAEADAPMNFDSLIRLERYARIDLGIRIDLPWEDLRRFSHKITIDEPHGPNDDVTECVGPHIAVGKIEYGGEEPGVLIYIKSCMSGDENDLIRDYRRRNSSFPHETTLDQFFTEEQFEVYRALGFHATQNFFTGNDRFACRHINVSEGWSTRVETALRRLNVPEAAVAAIVLRQQEFEAI